MRYAVRINRKTKNVRVYKVLKRTTGNVNIATKLFMTLFSGRKKKEEQIKI